MASNIALNKSQLRKLAREYALGNLEEGEYLHRRRTLVDDIVNGTVAIVREVPPPPPQAYSEDPTTKVSIAGRYGTKRVPPAALLIVIGILAGIVWMLIPGGGQQGESVDPRAHAPPVSRARSLIDEFVIEKDFSAFSIASFKESWSHLTYAEKREAYSAPWFNGLVNLVSDEIKAQNALLDTQEAAYAAEMGRRLWEFASFMGISDYVAEFRSLPAPPAEDVAVSDSSLSDNLTGTLNEIASQQPAQSPTTVAARDLNPEVELASVNNIDAGGPTSHQPPLLEHETPTPVSDSEWLDAQPADAYTLQLFTMNQLHEIQNLIAANQDVGLKVLVSARNEPRYRVVYGAFDSEEAALGAYAELPEKIRQAQPAPLVKSLSSLGDEIGVAQPVAAVDASKYTLQVFATDNVDSARRLQQDYPELDLSLLETTNPYTRYRVLYGMFDSEEMAGQAAGDLPAALLQDLGDPSIKAVGDLQGVKR
jgi:septal ring-binding cell division protein DamX